MYFIVSYTTPIMLIMYLQVNKATVTVNVQCCHVGYEYNNDTGKCMFMYDQRSNDILRPDASQAHIYIRVRYVF